MHSRWYLETYPDVAALGMEPATHYLRYGAAMGRNPGKSFDTQFYQQTYPEAIESALNPLVHYMLHGSSKGYASRPPRQRLSNAQNLVNPIRSKLLSLGFTAQPLADLRAIVANNPDALARATAARELALWHMRTKTPESYRAAIDYIAAARAGEADLDFRSKLAIAEMMCHHFLNDPSAGNAAYDEAALAGHVTPDLLLARVNCERDPAARISWINQVLQRYDIPPVALLPDDGRPLYDRLTSAVRLPPVVEGPKVTVLIAAYDAADMLSTALRSLQEQTWQNLEILVLDDCSPNPDTCAVAERFAGSDSRIRLIRMAQNGGAYVARNHGLDAATGEFVTLHDADDWSHPLKIETQVRFMQAHTEVMGCTSEQARCLDDLSFAKLRGSGGFIVFNTSSFLWRREPVHAAIGYWDSVRFGADNEFIRRMQIVFGKKSFQKIPTGPLSFQREAESSITGDSIKGLDSGGQYYGVRREYYDAQMHHHKTASSLKYGNDPSRSAFPVPPMMTMPGSAGYQRSFDVVICEDVRMGNPAVAALCTEVAAFAEESKRVGLLELHRYDADLEPVAPEIRDLLARGLAEMVVYGDVVEAQDIHYRHDVSAGMESRFMPTLIQRTKPDRPE